jgi:hypothetical protein
MFANGQPGALKNVRRRIASRINIGMASGAAIAPRSVAGGMAG